MSLIRHRIVGATVATTAIVAAAGLAFGQVAAADSGNTPVNQQVTDAVTQTNVKVSADAPDMPMSSTPPAPTPATPATTSAAAPSPVAQANAMPQAVQSTVYLPGPLIADAFRSPITTRARSLDDLEEARRFIEKRLDAIHERLEQCGSTCIMNIQVHGLGSGSSTEITETDEVTAWIISEERERLADDELATISYVGDGATSTLRKRAPLTSTTGVEYLVQDIGADLRSQIANLP